MSSLTIEQKATNYDTMKHIRMVGCLLHQIAKELMDRADEHDQSKLESPEVEILTNATPLEGLTFDSPEYIESKRKIKAALDHHYARNSHHPEFWKNGVDDMTLVDLTEMLVDWMCSSKRHNDGNIRKSIEFNAKRFNIGSQLVKIFENTVESLER